MEGEEGVSSGEKVLLSSSSPLWAQAQPAAQGRETTEALPALIVAQRLKTPGFGAARLVREFDLPVGKGAGAGIL